MQSSVRLVSGIGFLHMHWHQVYTYFCTRRPWVNQSLSHHNALANSSKPGTSEPVILTMCGLEWTISYFAESCNLNITAIACERWQAHISTQNWRRGVAQTGRDVHVRNLSPEWTDTTKSSRGWPMKMSPHLSLSAASRCRLSVRRLCLSRENWMYWDFSQLLLSKLSGSLHGFYLLHERQKEMRSPTHTHPGI